MQVDVGCCAGGHCRSDRTRSVGCGMSRGDSERQELDALRLLESMMRTGCQRRWWPDMIA